MAIVILKHSSSTGALRLGATLRDYGHRLNTIHLHQGDTVPADLNDVDGVVACGGPQSASDSDGWIADELDYLRSAHDAGVPIIGFCFGSQLLARALGGEVGPMDGGIELGWHEVALTPTGREDILHAGIAWKSNQFHWHREQVTGLPPDARVISGSERCPNQVWALGLRTYGIQHHPEVYEQTIETWANEEPSDLDEAGITLGQLRVQNDQHYGEYQRLAERLFESVALFLMPADRRIRGVAKDLHH